MTELRLNTFSIIGCDPTNPEIGIAVASKWLAVGSLVPYVQRGVGAVASQAWVNTSFGPAGLNMLATSMEPRHVIREMLKTDEHPRNRQVAVMDITGNAAFHTGKECDLWAGGMLGDHCVVVGNTRAGDNVLLAMRETFEKTPGRLAHRLLEALSVGEKAGGDRRGKQSAALLLASGSKDSEDGEGKVDLRIDDHTDPVKELGRLLRKHVDFYSSHL